MRIQHNIMAMNAYRNFNRNTSALSKNLEKLSSGYKINRAGDDAAGLAISEKMRAQITGLTQAQSNAKSGINLVQTAEGAMQEVHDMLNRMVKLADQSANGTYDNETDRVQLQKEVDQLKDEINRIADASNFNGINLLDGSLEQKTAVTAPQDVTVTADADGAMAAAGQAGVYSFDLSQLVLTNTDASNSATATITIAGKSFTAAIGPGGSITGKDVIKAIMGTNTSVAVTIGGNSDAFTITADGDKLTFTMDNVPTASFTQSMTMTIADAESNQGNTVASKVEQAAVMAGDRKHAQGSFSLTTDMVKDGGTLTIGDTTYTFAVGKDSKFAGAGNVIDLTDLKATDTNLLVEAASRLSKVAAGNKNFLVTADGQTGNVYLTEKEGGVDYEKNDLAGAASSSADGDWTGLIMAGTADPAKSTGGLTLRIGDTSDKFNQLTVSIQDMHTKSLGLDGVDISSQDGAAAAVDIIKDAINTVSDVRGTLGATQNRLDHTINNLSVMTENIQDAESTIRDTDVAEEMMAYTKNNILIQSAQAMLAQANQVPQGVLQLLG